MPPSAGACHTTDAELKPDCSRAGERSSIITAITGSLARAGVVSSPSSGATALTGVGSGDGDNEGLGLAESVGAPETRVEPGVPLEAAATGLRDEPREAAGPKKPPADAAKATPATTTAMRASAIARARSDEVMD